MSDLCGSSGCARRLRRQRHVVTDSLAGGDPIPGAAAPAAYAPSACAPTYHRGVETLSPAAEALCGVVSGLDAWRGATTER